MAIERIFYCEGPDCGDGQPVGVRTATPAPYLPESIIETREKSDRGDVTHYFCGWDCLMKFAADQPIPERIDFDASPGDNDG